MATERLLRFLCFLSLLLSTSAAVPPRVEAGGDCGGRTEFEIIDPSVGGDDDSGVGGTGIGEIQREPNASERYVRDRDDDSGIGGTGRQPSTPDDQGSGVGGTGILGRVSRTAGLCVNGFEISLPANLSIESESGSMQSAVSVGQYVWVRAEEVDGRLTASRIVVYGDETTPPSDALVTKVLRENRGLAYLSIEADLAGTPGRPRIGDFELELGEVRERIPRSGLQPGMRVRVGGRIDDRGRFEVTPTERPERRDRGTRPQGPGSTNEAPEAQRPEPQGKRAPARDTPPRPVRVPPDVRPEPPEIPRGPRDIRPERPPRRPPRPRDVPIDRVQR